MPLHPLSKPRRRSREIHAWRKVHRCTRVTRKIAIRSKTFHWRCKICRRREILNGCVTLIDGWGEVVSGCVVSVIAMLLAVLLLLEVICGGVRFAGGILWCEHVRIHRRREILLRSEIPSLLGSEISSLARGEITRWHGRSKVSVDGCKVSMDRWCEIIYRCESLAGCVVLHAVLTTRGCCALALLTRCVWRDRCLRCKVPR